jgi:hypothetical protein
MQRRIQLLRQLVLDSLYAIDDATIAEAILTRSRARRLIPETVFRNDVRGPQVQSFRPSRHARSFRPCSPARSSKELAAIASWRRT